MPEPGMGSRGSRGGSGMGGGGGSGGRGNGGGGGREDRDFGFEDKRANRRAFLLDDTPAVAPVVAVKPAVSFKTRAGPSYVHPYAGEPVRQPAKSQGLISRHKPGNEAEESRQEVIKSLANRKSNILSRTPDDSMSILEAYGLTGGTSKYGPGGFIGIKAAETPGAGGWFTSGDEEKQRSGEIKLSHSNFADPISRTRVGSHELMHSTLENLPLEDISFPQMDEYGRKFGRKGRVYDWGDQDWNKFARTNDPFAFEDWKTLDASDWTLKDFAQSLEMDDAPYDEAGTYPVGHEWAYENVSKNPSWFGRQWDPRFRSPQSSAQGQQDWADWLAYQRELPGEKFGGARVRGPGSSAGQYGWINRTLPWGPATVVDEFGNKGTGLGNWPVGDQHAIVAANAASYPVQGDVFEDWYGNLATHNLEAMRKAHPSTRLSTMMKSNLPAAALQAMESYIQQNPWSGTGETPQQAMDRVRRYVASIGGGVPSDEELATALNPNMAKRGIVTNQTTPGESPGYNWWK